jgi:hypothetical protein
LEAEAEVEGERREAQRWCSRKKVRTENKKRSKRKAEWRKFGEELRKGGDPKRHNLRYAFSRTVSVLLH